MFAVLRHPAFRWIWLGALVSNTGNWMEAVAQSWLVQQQTGSPFMVELLAASEFVPHAVLMLAAGWLADHYNRRKLLLAGQSVMMVLGAVLAVAAHLGWATPWVIIAISFAEGAAWASVTPSWQAVIPALVPRSELPSAIALNSAQFNTARLLGPMIAGALLSAASAAFVFDLNVVSFIGIVVVLAAIRVPEAELAAAHTSGGELMQSGGIRPALRWAVYEPGPRRIILGVFAFALLAAPVQGLMAPMADEVLHIGAHGYGILLSCLGAGAIAGALTLARLPRSYPRHHLIPLSMLAFALCALVYGGSRWPLLSGAALVVGGVFWVWSLASSTTAMQLLVPERLRGRAMSVLALATTGPLPLGHLLGGTVAHALGIRAGILVSCGVLAAFCAWSTLAREPGIDDMKLPPPPARGLRAALWEALTAASHRAQVAEPRAAEPLED
ncbi:MAG: MFS transporter [Deltaproteobacteria bacterium]|jgi:MFS family permease|nr:MAG: MFS transporter [Deltaproteobacteria bacterium]